MKTGEMIAILQKQKELTQAQMAKICHAWFLPYVETTVSYGRPHRYRLK